MGQSDEPDRQELQEFLDCQDVMEIKDSQEHKEKWEQKVREAHQAHEVKKERRDFQAYLVTMMATEDQLDLRVTVDHQESRVRLDCLDKILLIHLEIFSRTLSQTLQIDS